MKKFMSIVLCLAMLISMCTVFGDETSEMQKVLAIVKGRVDIPQSLTKFEYHIEQGAYGTNYGFSWSTEKEGDYESINVSCYINGVISSYNYYKNNDERGDSAVRFLKLSRSDAKLKAQEFVKMLNPDVYSQIAFKEDNPHPFIWARNHNFDLTRTINGVPFNENSGSIQVDDKTGQVTMFNINWWGEATFDDASKVIDVAKAQKAYSEKIGLKLVYQSRMDGEKNVVYPAYIPKGNNSEVIDAITGEKIAFQRTDMYYAGGNGRDAKNSMMEKSKPQFTPQEITKIGENQKLITAEKAEAIVRADKIIALENKEKPNATLYEDYGKKGEYVWNLYFQGNMDIKAEKIIFPQTGLSVSLNAKTGEITSFSYNIQDEKEVANKNITEAVAEKTANSVLTAFANDRAGSFKKEDTVNYDLSPPKVFNFNYVRNVNGIPFYENTAYISVSAISGRVLSYNSSWSDVEFPSIANVITPEKAAARLFEQAKYTLGYIGDYSKYKPYMSSMPPQTTKLAYVFDNSVNILLDAFDGKLIDAYGKPQDSEKLKVYNDIKGHYAEEQIKKLLYYGIAFDGDAFRPDDVMLQKDYLALLNMVFNNYNTVNMSDKSQVDSMYSNFRMSGIVKDDEKAPDKPITREDSVKFLVRAMGIEKYALIKGIYNCQFTDVTDYIGHISLVAGLGIANGNGDGTFGPKEILSRAQGMVMIYNYLTK